MDQSARPKAPHRFDPSEADRLLDPRRRGDVDPSVVLAALDLRPGMRIADIGCGNGFWLEHLLNGAPEGVRFDAMDVSPEMLETLERRLAGHPRWSDVTLHRSEGDRLPLPDACLDGALLMNVHHEVDDRSAFLSEILRVLRPGGRLVIVDWDRVPDAVRPDRGPPLDHRVGRETALREMSTAGFTDIRPLPTAPDLFGLVGGRPAGDP